jgi:hypothetical protein
MDCIPNAIVVENEPNSAVNAETSQKGPDPQATFDMLKHRIENLAAGDINEAELIKSELVASSLPPEYFKLTIKLLAGRAGADAAAMYKEVMRARASLEQSRAPSSNAEAEDGPSPYLLPEPAECDPQDLKVLAFVLDQIVKVIQRRVVCSIEAAWAIALWIVCTWGLRPPGVAGGPYIFPRLLITAPTKRAGKSTLLETVMALCRRPIMASNITVAALFRTISAFFPTLGIDEADNSLRNNPELIGVTNSGHSRNGSVIRAVEVQKRRAGGGAMKDFEPRAYSTFCPMVIAGIGRQAHTTADRSIRIAMQRQPASALSNPMEFDKLRAVREHVAPMLAAHADAMAGAMAQDGPPIVFPAWLGSRDRDNWRPLIRVADLAGDPWPARIQQAVNALCRDGDDRLSTGEQLLADIREFAREERIVAASRLLTRWAAAKGLQHSVGTNPLAGRSGRPCDFILSADLAAWLMQKDDSIIARERDVNAAKLKISGLLRGFGIRPVQRNVGRGYQLRSLKIAWRRYL